MVNAATATLYQDDDFKQTNLTDKKSDISTFTTGSEAKQ
ncbi:MAG: hypothetical protein JWP57_4719 [Spirosoma sp.]|nr:hypothetical protein [Spirosoma sp.]